MKGRGICYSVHHHLLNPHVILSSFKYPVSMSIYSGRLCSVSFSHRGCCSDEGIGSKNLGVVNRLIRIARLTIPQLTHHHHLLRRRHSSINSNYPANGMSGSQSYPPEREDSMEVEYTQQKQSWSTTKVLEQLKRYGVSGVLSYGLLNTAYYLTTFLTVWFYFAPAPGKMGYLAAVSRFLKVMAMVWAGSQVTKLFRAAGALALAPVVDKGLSWFTVRFKFESRAKAFFTIVGFCFGLAVILFLVVTVLSA